jgi:predicted nucleic acid-binding protein
MSDVFVDTAGWAELADKTQPFHKVATNLYRQAKQQDRKLVTTNYVLAETVELLTSPLRLPRTRIIGYIQSLRQSPYIEIVHIDEELDEQAWQLLAARQDKMWSLVDCSSFVVMQVLGITEALITDHHFEQAGLVRLLEP